MSNTKISLLTIASFILILLFPPLGIILLILLVKNNPDNKYVQYMPYVFMGLLAFAVGSALPNINDIAPSTQHQLLGSGIGALIAVATISYGLVKVGKRFSTQ